MGKGSQLNPNETRYQPDLALSDSSRDMSFVYRRKRIYPNIIFWIRDVSGKFIHE